jgi:hypothetical protein
MKTLILAAALIATPALADDAQDMAQVVTGFYTVHQKTDQDGIPSAKVRAQYAPYISPALDKLLVAGDAAETKYAKENKDSPPLVEGDLFSPNFEGISAFKVGGCDPKVGHCQMKGHYGAKNPRPQDKPVDWTDTIYLVKTASGWRVDDIAYGGNWDFGNHGRLSETLKSAVNDANGAP